MAPHDVAVPGVRSGDIAGRTNEVDRRARFALTHDVRMTSWCAKALVVGADDDVALVEQRVGEAGEIARPERRRTDVGDAGGAVRPRHDREPVRGGWRAGNSHEPRD